MNEETRGGKREGSGRKKGLNKPFLVRCNPKVIIDVRKYAKEKSEDFINNQKTK